VPRGIGKQDRFTPYSDFLLHDIGTGDGIVQAGPAGHGEQIAYRPTVGVWRDAPPLHARPEIPDAAKNAIGASRR